MKKNIFTLVTLLVLLISHNAYAVWDDITFNQNATISNGDHYVRVFIHDSDETTEVNVSGGQIGTLLSYDQSIANVSGGTFSPEYYSYHPGNNDGDNIFLFPYMYSIYVNDSSILNYSDGSIQSISCADQATANILGGSTSLFFADSAVINITGGNITGISKAKSFFDPQSDAHLSISGGNFTGHVSLVDNSVAHIYGYDFFYDPDGWVSSNPRFPVVAGGQLRGYWADGTAFAINFTDIFEHSYDHVVLHEIPKYVSVDIKPGSCPNPVNVKSKGMLPVAILGTEEFEVSAIDAASIFLNGVPAIRSSYEDAGGPVANPNECECTTEAGDGFGDLVLKFYTQQIVETLGEVNAGDILTLTLTGVLNDGTGIEGADCVVIVGRHKPINKADINKDGVVNTVDIAIVAENWLNSSIVEE